ncbi:hypothetical protein OF83DRAFT_899213 [Amylostereum chailletii]|nr:hypothetical protein OF83DRAFT_899213 [Amylostereum chailletii]
MPAVVDIKATLGAVLLGGFVSVALSGIVVAQVFHYYRTYRKDPLPTKLLVVLVWALDAVHTGLICAAVWRYLVLEFGNPAVKDEVVTEISLTIAFTATMTFVVHLFFCHRIYLLSRRNWLVVIPLILLAFGRLGFAMVTTVKMITFGSWSKFVEHESWTLTLGLSLSLSLDIFIAFGMFFYLQHSRTGFGTMDRVIDLITIYSFQTGSITCVATIATLACWRGMSDNLVFFGLHFSITKLYASSLLITLNTRHSLRLRTGGRAPDAPPIVLMHHLHGVNPSTGNGTHPALDALQHDGPTQLEINVDIEKSVRYELGPERTAGGALAPTF